MSDSSIRQRASDFLVYKRSLGYLYESQEYYLWNFVSYVEKVAPDAEYPTKQVIDPYLDSIQGSGSNLFATVTLLRELSNYLQIRGYPEAYVVPPKVASQPVPEPPYFFTAEEITSFFAKLDEMKPHTSFKGKELVIPAMFRLLYCCGMRPKEARTLKCVNVHLSELFIDILQSKGPKSRRIFISQELTEYLDDYNKRISILFPQREFFFPARDGRPYGSSAISGNFRKFWWEAYPDFPKGSRPRAYDFRHHFAWTNINQWAAEGMDVNVMLPYLMRYMGHQTVAETLYYFHFVPEFFPTFREIAKPLENIIPEVWDED